MQQENRAVNSYIQRNRGVEGGGLDHGLPITVSLETEASILPDLIQHRTNILGAGLGGDLQSDIMLTPFHRKIA